MKVSKILCVMLVVSCLALSSLMASPSTWAWLTSSQPSTSSDVLEETLTEVAEVSMKDSEDSKATSKTKGKVEYVTIPKAEYEEALAKIEEGNAYNKKGGVQVTEATDYLSALAAPVKADKWQNFATLDVEHGFGAELKLGASFGFIFKNCLIGSFGIMKTGLSDWMNKETYVGRASVGIIF